MRIELRRGRARRRFREVTATIRREHGPSVSFFEAYDAAPYNEQQRWRRYAQILLKLGDAWWLGRHGYPRRWITMYQQGAKVTRSTNMTDNRPVPRRQHVPALARVAWTDRAELN